MNWDTATMCLLICSLSLLLHHSIFSFFLMSKQRLHVLIRPREKKGVFIQFSLNCACLKCFSEGSAVSAVVAFFSSAAQGDFLFFLFFRLIYNSKCL